MRFDSLAVGTETTPSRTHPGQVELRPTRADRRPGGRAPAPPGLRRRSCSQARSQPLTAPCSSGRTGHQLPVARPREERRLSPTPRSPGSEHGVSRNVSRTEQISPSLWTPQGSVNARQHWYRTSQGKLRGWRARRSRAQAARAGDRAGAERRAGNRSLEHKRLSPGAQPRPRTRDRRPGRTRRQPASQRLEAHQPRKGRCGDLLSSIFKLHNHRIAPATT
jgi:hypothetical protein